VIFSSRGEHLSGSFAAPPRPFKSGMESTVSDSHKWPTRHISKGSPPRSGLCQNKDYGVTSGIFPMHLCLLLRSFGIECDIPLCYAQPGPIFTSLKRISLVSNPHVPVKI